MAIANALAFLLYLSSSVILIRDFVKRDHNANKLALPIGILTTLALLFHAADIYFTMKFAQGWDLSLMSTLSIAAWLMAVIAMLAGMRSPVAHPGIVVYPLVALCLMLKVEALEEVSATSVIPLWSGIFYYRLLPMLCWHLRLCNQSFWRYRKNNYVINMPVAWFVNCLHYKQWKRHYSNCFIPVLYY